MIDFDKLEVPDEYKKYISITLSLTTECNYKCWYCYQNNMERSTKIDYEDCIKFVKQVQDKYPEKEVLVLLMGGETLHYKHINELIDELYDMNVKIDVTTNGSKTEKWWKEYGYKINNVTVSYHHNEVTPEKFIKQCKYITENCVRHVSVAVMLEPKHFDEIYQVARDLADQVDNLMILLKPVWNSLRLSDFTDFTKRQYEYILKNRKIKSKKIKFTKSPFDLVDILLIKDKLVSAVPLNEFTLKRRAKFKGYYCYSGIESFFVDYDGDVYRANCLIENLGNISEKIVLPDDPILCIHDECYCRTDVFITKVKKEIYEKDI